MLIVYKYRIYPNLTQEHLINKTFGVSRVVYNLALETKRRVWESARISLSSFDLNRQLPDLKNEYPWMKEVDSGALNCAILNVEKAFKVFYAGGGFPKFKKKSSCQSFSTMGNTRKIDWINKTISIPKIKDIPIVLSRKFTGDIKTVTISRTATGKYYASVLVDNKVQSIPKAIVELKSSIGIDLGIKSFITTSNGIKYDSNKFLKNNLSRLKILQKRASKKKKGSNNRKKENLRVAKLHEKIANQRADYIHKITTELIRDSQANTFVIEDLNVAGLIKNKTLSVSISDASFSEFRKQMAYKCDWYGKNLILIDQFAPSSKRCSNCGEVNQGLTLAVREWVCGCGACHNRDINAAKN